MMIIRNIIGKLCGILAALSILSMAGAQTQYRLDSAYVEWRFGMYIHFNMNTFYPGWGESRVDPKTFAPTKLDCGQWARAAKSAGMKYAALTTKHHDGFALWPSQQTPPNGQTPYTVMQSSYPHDIVRMFVDSFRVYGVTPCFYFSIWDAANGISGSYTNPRTIINSSSSWPRCSTFVLGQLRELLGGTYGQIPFLIFDGYAWNMGYWAYPMQRIRALVKELQPNCLITDHNGMLSPWGLDIVDFEEPLGIQAPNGNIYAGQQEQTISGDWFWDSTARNINSSKFKSVSTITQHLTRLQPLYTNFLLNCPPNRQGLLDTAIVTRLGQVGQAWTPAVRAPLPAQPATILRPVNPVTVTGTSNSDSVLNVIDNTNDFSGGHKQSLWQSTGTLPQSVTMDLGKVYDSLDMLMYEPRRFGSTSGNITSYQISVSTDNSTFSQVASGIWSGDSTVKKAALPDVSARYVRLTAVAAGSTSYAVICNLLVGYTADYPQTTGIRNKGAARAGVQTLRRAHTGRLGPGSLKTGSQARIYTLAGKTVRRNHATSVKVKAPEGIYIINNNSSR